MRKSRNLQCKKIHSKNNLFLPFQSITDESFLAHEIPINHIKNAYTFKNYMHMCVPMNPRFRTDEHADMRYHAPRHAHDFASERIYE